MRYPCNCNVLASRKLRKVKLANFISTKRHPYNTLFYVVVHIGTDLHMTTEATLVCSCTGECGGYFRFVGEGGEATEKMPVSAGEGSIAVGGGAP